MVMPQRETITFRDADLIFKNFTGEERKYNKKGDRNFCVVLPEEVAADMARKGWNVKMRPPRNDEEGPLHFIKVAVNFERKPPRCWLVTASGTKRTMLLESVIEILDDLDPSKVDLTIVAYDYHLDTGSSGRKAYLQSLFYHPYEDELELEYGDVDVIPTLGDSATPRGIESGALQSYDYDNEVVE